MYTHTHTHTHTFTCTLALTNNIEAKGSTLLLDEARGGHVGPPGPLVLDHDLVCHLVHHPQRRNQILFCVCGGYAEAHAGLDEGRGGEADDDDGELAEETLARKCRDLGGVVKHHGYHGRILVPQHLCARVCAGVCARACERCVYTYGDLSRAHTRTLGVGLSP